LVNQTVCLVEPAPEDPQHGPTSRHHHSSLGVTSHDYLSFIRSQCRFGFGDPAQLHQADEAPEQAAACPGVVTGCPSQIDDLGPGRQAVLGAGRIPKGVQPGVEHLGEHLAIPRPAGQIERLIDERAAAGPGSRVADQFAGQPSQQASPHGVVECSHQGTLQKTGQFHVHVEKRRLRLGLERQVDQRIVAITQIRQATGQSQSRTGQSPGGHPQGPAGASRGTTDHRPQVLLVQPAEPDLLAHPDGLARGGHQRGRRRGHPGGQDRQHLDRLTSPPIDVVDQDQPAGAACQLSRRPIKS
jgi:hypothetical protein